MHLSTQLIPRPTYLKKLKSLKNITDLVKIITGVRRCGKSKLFEIFQHHLLADDNIEKNQIININLEDVFQTRSIGLTLTIDKKLTHFYQLIDYIVPKLQEGKMNYVFLDEIQLLENWQLAANALRLIENVDLYLTGSNAYMFSGDLANVFGGRYMEIKMQPLSFSEYYSSFENRADFKSQNMQTAYMTYVKESGFPQTIEFLGDNALINDYLKDTVYLNTIQKDIIQRFSLSDTAKMDALVLYLFDNIGSETSVRNIENQLKSSGNGASVPTIQKYIQGLLDSYLLYKCDRFDVKGKHILTQNPKYYVCDMGLRAAILNASPDRDWGHILENVVYLELIHRGYSVHVGKISKMVNQKRKNIEIDFIAQKPDGTREYYQVALYALDENVLQRELASLQEISDNYPKILLSMDFGNGDIDGIKRLNVFDWLLS